MMTSSSLTERLATLGPAGRAANKVWADEQVRQALETIKRVLPYNPEVPGPVLQWLKPSSS